MIYAFGAFELDGERFELRRDGRRVPLAPKAFDLLAYLVQHRDREVSKDELLGALWPDGDVADWSLARALHVVRRALDETSEGPHVRTLRGRGYRFTAAVEVRPAAAPACAEAVATRDPFVGRAEPLTRLRAAIDAAVAGQGQLVFVTGEAGIGKSRLAGEAAVYATSRGAEVLVGRCPEDQGAPAFRPWAQIVRAFAEAREPGVLAAILGPGAADLLRAIPELGEYLPGLPPAPALEPAQARLRLFEAMRAFLQAAAADRVLVLLLDDLHRADELSLRQLASLAPRVSQARVLVIGTFRDVDAAQDAVRGPLLAELARAAPEAIVALGGLARDDVGLLLEQALGGPVPPARVEDLHARTAGNPLFLVQLVRLLASARQGMGGAADEPSLPRALRDAIRGQLDTVSEECRELLVVASVIGREFPVALLAAACGRSLEEAERVVAEAGAARVVAPGHDAGTLRFAHVVVRDVLYGDLTPARRVALHRSVAQSLEAQSAGGESPLAELAHHFFEAAPGGDVEPALAYAVRAAERAAARLAYEEAVLHGERALELLELRGSDDARRRCEILLALGQARMRVLESRPGGDPKSAREALAWAAELAARARAPDLLARAALAFGGTDDLAGQVLVLDTAHVGLLEESLRALGSEHAGLRVHVLERLAKALYWSDAAERRAELSREAVETAGRAGEPRALARAAYGRRWGLRVPEELELQLGAAEETVRLAEAAGAPSLLVAGRVWLVHERMAAGDPRGASAEIDEYVRLAGDLRVRLYPSFFFRAALAILAGRFDDGEQLAREGLAAAEGSPWALDAGMSYGTQLALLRTEQGRTAEVEPMLKLFVARYPALPGWRAGLAAVYAEEGRSAEAREQFEILAQRDFTDVPRDVNWTHTLAVLAETCAHLRDVQRAERLYAILGPRAGRAVMVGYATGCWGSVSRWLGLLAETLSRPDEAARHFEAALAANAAMGARSWVARTQVDAARLLAARDQPGDRTAARLLLAAARPTAQELGMALVAERASALERGLAG